MRSFSFLALLVAVLISITSTSYVKAADIDCNNPCGPIEFLACLGDADNPSDNSAKTAFNQKVFNDGSTKTRPSDLDTYCVKAQVDSENSEVLNWYIANICSKQKGGYASYENFKAAYESFVNAKFIKIEDLACQKTAVIFEPLNITRLKETANIFATITQETTGRSAPYTLGNLNATLNDGLYYRFEVGALPKTCSFSECRTIYFDQTSQMVVAAKQNNDGSWLVYTQAYWNSGNFTPNRMQVSGNKVNLSSTPNNWRWSSAESAPDGFKFYKLTEVVPDYFWIGMGPKQLTGNTMMEFFGWYYNNLSQPNLQSADLKSFIISFLTDGKLGFQGSLYYWMYRVNGANRPTIHDTVSSQGNVCHDIGLVTRLINGGCNQFDPGLDPNNTPYPGRVGYYYYFHTKLLNAKIKAQQQSYLDISYSPAKAFVLDSMTCNYPGATNNIGPLEKFCYENTPLNKPISGKFSRSPRVNLRP